MQNWSRSSLDSSLRSSESFPGAPSGRGSRGRRLEVDFRLLNDLRGARLRVDRAVPAQLGGDHLELLKGCG